MGLAILNRVVMVNPWVSQVGLVVKKPACQCRRCKKHGFNPWVGKIPWRRAWKSTPIFLPGESPQRSLAGYSLWGHNKSDTSEWSKHSITPGGRGEQGRGYLNLFSHYAEPILYSSNCLFILKQSRKKNKKIGPQSHFPHLRTDSL